MSTQDLTMLGWREWLSLPELGIESIKAKVDTGARSSALHAFELDTFEENGVARVRFSIHPYQHDSDTVRTCVVDILDERSVTDSGGHQELRPVISTPVMIGDIRRDIEITLTNRETMKFRMLLGRTAMAGMFTVNPGQSYLLGEPTKGRNS